MFHKIFTFCVLLVLVQSAKLPKTWKTCKKNDPKINECLRGAVEDAIHELAREGAQPLGVLKLDPLRFNAMTVDQGEGPVSIKLDFSDLDIIGLKDIKITSVKTDWKKMEIEGEVPKLTLTGKYKINGQVLILPINGDGDCELVFTNFKPQCELKIKEVTKGGKKYYEVDKFHFGHDTEGVHVHFNNLFNGDKALGDTMNTFLNENSKDILKELGPAISTAFGAGFKNIANRIFSRVAENDISP